MLLTGSQPLLACLLSQVISPLDRSSSRRHPIRDGQRYSIHLGRTLPHRCLWRSERRVCYGSDRHPPLLTWSSLSALHCADVRSPGHQMGYGIIGLHLCGHAADSTSILQVRSSDSEEEQLQRILEQIEALLMATFCHLMS